MSTSDAAEQRRKLALLEARLIANDHSESTPVTPAVAPASSTTPRPDLPARPVSLASLSGSAFESSDDDERQHQEANHRDRDEETNPNTDTNANTNTNTNIKVPANASPSPPLPPSNHQASSTVGARRPKKNINNNLMDIVPDPPSSGAVDPSTAKNATKTNTTTTRPASSQAGPTAPRKRRRTGAGSNSPNSSNMRNSRVDSYFKPRSRDSSKDCIPLSARAKPPTPNNAVAQAAALLAAAPSTPASASDSARNHQASNHSSNAVNAPNNNNSSNNSAAAGVKRSISFGSPGGGERTPPSASSGFNARCVVQSNNNNSKNDRGGSTSASVANANPDNYRYMREMIERLRKDNERVAPLEARVNELEAETEDLKTQLEIELPMLREQASASAEAAAEKEKTAETLNVIRKALRDAVVEVAKMERREARRKVSAMGERVGRLGVERTRTQLQEVWEEGNEWREISRKLKDIQSERETIDKKRREIAKLKRKSSDDNNNDTDGKKEDTMKSVPFENTLAYFAEQEEIYRLSLQTLKREESNLIEQRARLTRERDVLIRELRRQGDEDLSEFNKFQTVNSRYVALNLLGKGGFSEVYKGFDLERGCYVACKIHQLASNWSELKKRTFIRHAMREYEIHKSLRHPRVVALEDIFEIDENTFCTVLEFCDGSDLDSYLRNVQTVPEREARSVIAQVVSGLVYLAEQAKRIIHYDLKPGNILFDRGAVRIADFGLSKIMGEGDTTQHGMELTSQGAGTMWYLPPECFETDARPRISNKVDVWSTGVITYQMLYGRKPFGHDQSQEKMFREKTPATAQLTFPNKPQVSDAAKQFIAACLTRDVHTRPGVQQLQQLPFLKKK